MDSYYCGRRRKDKIRAGRTLGTSVTEKTLIEVSCKKDNRDENCYDVAGGGYWNSCDRNTEKRKLQSLRTIILEIT